MLTQKQKEILAMVEQITEWATDRAIELNKDDAISLCNEFDEWISYTEKGLSKINQVITMKNNGL